MLANAIPTEATLNQGAVLRDAPLEFVLALTAGCLICDSIGKRMSRSVSDLHDSAFVAARLLAAADFESDRFADRGRGKYHSRLS